jgi:hypothetical protein
VGVLVAQRAGAGDARWRVHGLRRDGAHRSELPVRDLEAEVISPMLIKLGAGALLALGALALWQRSEIADGRTAAADERAAHAQTKAAHADTLARQAVVISGLAKDALRVQKALNQDEESRATGLQKEIDDAIAADRRRRGNPAVRVFVPGACPAAAPATHPGGGNVPAVPAAVASEPAAAELTGAARQRALDFRVNFDVDMAHLRYLQAYAAACHLGKPTSNVPATR